MCSSSFVLDVCPTCVYDTPAIINANIHKVSSYAKQTNKQT